TFSAMADLQISAAHIAENEPTLYHDEFRVRLVDHRVLPIVGNDSLFAQQQMVVIDYPDVEKPRFEDVDEDKENTIHTADTTLQAGGGSPLKFNFLTLDKLKEGDADLFNFKVSIRTITENTFPVNPIPVDRAFAIRQRLHNSDLPFFDADDKILPSSPIFFVCNASDEKRTVYVGIQRSASTCRLFNTECTGGLDVAGRDAILNNFDRFSLIGDKKCSTRMQIEILRPRLHKKEDEVDNTVDAISTLSVDYSTNEYDIAQMPSSTAYATLNFSPGWCDPRVDYDLKTRDLQLMMVMARALHSDIPFDWTHAGERKKKDSEIQSEVRALIANTNQQVTTDESKRYIDFTERLWEILRECRSNELLVKCLQIIYSAVRSKSINTILHDDNYSSLATLIRDSCKGKEVRPPRLEGLQPIDTLLEIAVEKFRRDLVTEFVKRSFVASEGDIRDMLMRSLERVKATKDKVVDDTRALIPLHLGLQTISHLEGTLILTHRNTLAKYTKDVITRYMSKEITNFHDVNFELRIPLIQVKPEIIPGMKPASFSTEVIYKCKDGNQKGNERARAHLFLARTPPLRGLEGVLANIDDPSNRYVATVTKCTTLTMKKKIVKKDGRSEA
ncbi:zwl-1, partial [Pristionchus pacificus]